MLWCWEINFWFDTYFYDLIAQPRIGLDQRAIFQFWKAIDKRAGFILQHRRGLFLIVKIQPVSEQSAAWKRDSTSSLPPTKLTAGATMEAFVQVEKDVATFEPQDSPIAYENPNFIFVDLTAEAREAHYKTTAAFSFGIYTLFGTEKSNDGELCKDYSSWLRLESLEVWLKALTYERCQRLWSRRIHVDSGRETSRASDITILLFSEKHVPAWPLSQNKEQNFKMQIQQAQESIQVEQNKSNRKGPTLRDIVTKGPVFLNQLKTFILFEVVRPLKVNKWLNARARNLTQIPNISRRHCTSKELQSFCIVKRMGYQLQVGPLRSLRGYSMETGSEARALRAVPYTKESVQDHGRRTLTAA